MIKRTETTAKPTTVSAAAVAACSDVEACILWLELLFPGGNIVAFYRAMMRRHISAGSPNSSRADEACLHLVSRGLMKLVRRMATADAREYKANVRYDAGGLATLRDRAVAGRWFPTPELICETFDRMRSYGNADTQAHYEYPKTAWQRAATVCAALGCRIDTHEDPNSENPAFVTSDSAFDGASFLTGNLTEDVRLLSGELGGKTDVDLLPAIMSAFFCAGRDVGPMLDILQHTVESDRDLMLPGGVVLAYGALRVWRGEAASLDGIEGWMMSEDALRLAGAESAFKLAAAGEWKTAAAALAPLVSSRVLKDGNPILFPFLALAFAIFVQCNAPEQRIRKVAALMQKSVPPSVDESHWSHDAMREKVIGWIHKRTGAFKYAAKEGWSTMADARALADGFLTSFGSIPFCFALHSPGVTEAQEDPFDSWQAECEHLLQQALKALTAGYPLLAGILLAGYSRFGQASAEHARALTMFTNSGVPWLLPTYAHDAEWKRLVAELAKIVGADETGTDKETKAKSGHIVWGLEFQNAPDDILRKGESIETHKGDTEVIGCIAIAPYFRGPRAPSDGSGDKRLTVKGVTGDTYRSLMTDQDRRTVEELLKSRYNNLRDYRVPDAVVETLVDHPHLTETFTRACFGYGEADPPQAITLTRYAWNVASSSQPDGGLVLSVPPYLKAAVDAPCLLRPLGYDNVYFLKLNDRERTFVAGFFALAPNGRLALPPEALPSVAPVLTALTRVAPLEGNFAGLADQTDLERIAGTSALTARLALNGDVLEASLCVKPYPKNPALVLQPGVGSPERMVKDGGQTKVLVRDLSAENAALARVKSALVDCDGWAEGDMVWKVEDLADALELLAALKDLDEETVRMEWREGARLSVATSVTTKGGLTAKGGVDRWFRLSGTFTIDEETTLSLLQLLKAFRGRIGRFVPLGENGYLRLSAALQRRLEALDAAGRERDGALAVAPAAVPMLDGVFGKAKKDELALPTAIKQEAERIRAAFDVRHTPPDRLKATLRTYQEEGYAWLARLADCGFGACLADDMGLGKTVQLIALLLARAKDGASLVVAPTSVGGNWRREIARFAPTLTCLCAWETDDAEWQKAGPHDVVITSYGMLVSREEKFAARDWNGVVLDEAQAIKNEGTERARVVKRLAARFRVAATGTPVENRLTELWSIFDFLNPGMLGTSSEFVAKMTDEGHATPMLKNLVRPLILRRLKREVLDDLPDKTEITLSVPLEGAERAGYEACRRQALETLAQGGQDNRISILAELTRLRRYCCHPSLVLPEQADSAKMEALVELLRDLKGASHRVLVFSQFTDYLALVEARLQAEEITYQYLDGTTPPKERERRVAAFQQGEGDVLLMSLKAGGTGLNLTAANYVVLLDPWWNPAVEDQAADRVHRIGQKQPVTVYRLIASDTVEERVLELHAEKKQLATDVLEGTASSALTPEALMKLFG